MAYGFTLLILIPIYLYLLNKMRKVNVLILWLSVIVFLFSFIAPYVIDEIRSNIRGQIEEKKKMQFMRNISLKWNYQIDDSKIPFKFNYKKSLTRTNDSATGIVIYFENVDEKDLNKNEINQLIKLLPKIDSYYVIIFQIESDLNEINIYVSPYKKITNCIEKDLSKPFETCKNLNYFQLDRE